MINELVIKSFNPLQTEKDKYGSNILDMSNFSNSFYFEYTDNLKFDNFSLDNIPSDLSLITEAINEGSIIFGDKTMLIPDMDSLSREIKENLKSGLYKIGDSKQIEGNLRATIIDTSTNLRVKDITLKQVRDLNGSAESIRAIAIQAQLKNLSNKVDGLQELSMYQMDRQRDSDIKIKFLDARDFVLKAQNIDDIEMKKKYLIEAEKSMISGYNAIYTDFQTTAKHLAIADRFPSTKIKNAYMYYLQEDMIIATKMMGLRQAVLYALGETKTMTDVYALYQNNMKYLIEQPIGRKNRSAIGLMHDNYPYSKNNLDQWFNFPKEVAPLLTVSYNEIENGILITVAEEENYE